MAVSSPVASSSDPAVGRSSGSTGYANPLEATLVPCLDLPDLGHGYWDRVDYVTNDGTGFDMNTLRGLTVTDVACRPGGDCLRKYRLPDGRRRGQTRLPDGSTHDAPPGCTGRGVVVGAGRSVTVPVAVAAGRGGSSSSSGFSTISVSVVSSMPAIEEALTSAERVTLTGSRTPWATRSPYSPVAAL